MLVEVPEQFLHNPKTLALQNLTLLHYFNREVSEPIDIKINQHLLLHIFHGSKIIKKDDRTFRVNAKESLFVSRGQYVISEILSFENASFDGVMIFFDDNFLLDFFNKYIHVFKDLEQKAALESDLVSIQKESSLHDTMLSMKAYMNQKYSSEALLQLKFEEILLQALENDDAQSLYVYLKKLYSNGLLNFKNIFDTQEFTDVESMIKASRLPEEKFRKRFYELYGGTPKEWLRERTLNRAKHLLLEEDYNVSEVSQLCNFNSLSWFIKQFRTRFGVTPKQFQQNHQKTRQN